MLNNNNDYIKDEFGDLKILLEDDNAALIKELK